MKTCISCAFASTVDHQAKYHIRIYASAFVYTFGPPIWRRSDGCQAFGHVIENDLYGCLISFSNSYKLRTSCFKKKKTLGVNYSFPTIPKRVATAIVFFFLEDPNQNGSAIPPFYLWCQRRRLLRSYPSETEKNHSGWNLLVYKTIRAIQRTKLTSHRATVALLP